MMSAERDYLFPGMDPYLEHAVLWNGVRSGLIHEMRKPMAPGLRPRYAAIEERVDIEVPRQQRIPDLWIQQVSEEPVGGIATQQATPPVVVEVPEIDIREGYLEILDLHRNQEVVYPNRLEDRLPTINVPLREPDPDIPLNLQEAVERLYQDGGFLFRLKYDEACPPALNDQKAQRAKGIIDATRNREPKTDE